MAKRIILTLLCVFLFLPSIGLASSTDEPLAPVLEDVTIKPSEARVGDLITITAKIQSPYYALKRVQAQLTGDTDKLIELTYQAADGTWVGTYQVQAYDHQGKWAVKFYLHGQEYWWYRDSGKMITVINPGEDRVQPVVNSIQMEPGTVVAGEPFKVRVKATDESGIESVKANFLMPNGGTRVGQPLTYNSAKDEWYFTYTFERNTEPGDWKIEVEVVDKASNKRTSVQSFVLANPDADFTPPVTKDVKVNKSEISAGESLTVTANITDNKSGIETATLMLCSMANCYQAPFVFNSETELWDAVFTYHPEVMEEGSYQVDIQVYDKAGNISYPDLDQVVKLKKLSGWVFRDGKWFYYDPMTFQLKTGWYKDGTVWYYSDANGVMLTGWQKIGGVWYYFNGCGAMQTGWQKLGTTWYYFAGSGAMQTGWLKQGTTWYYFSVSGAMVTGWNQQGTTWYYFGTSGAMQVGWLKSGVSWYYFKSSGAMATGWQTISGKSYYFYSNGALK